MVITDRTAPLPAPSPSSEAELLSTLDAAAEGAWTLIAPLWPLQSFVAVNPFMGLTNRPFVEATAEVDRLFHARSTLPLEWYRARMNEGRLTDQDLLLADEELGAPARSNPSRVLSYAAAVDEQTGSTWRSAIVEEIAKWCAARFDGGQAAWTLPWSDLGVWEAWREAARIDRGPELRGLIGFRTYAGALSTDPREALLTIMRQLGVPPEAWRDVFARSLFDIRGWAGHVRYLTREAAMSGGDDGNLAIELLAVRMAYDGALRAGLGAPGRPWSDIAHGVPGTDGNTRRAHLRQQIGFEHGYRRALIERLNEGRPLTLDVKPALQAAFCIDVRSEIFRRHLEHLSPRIQTIGFAGFFGFPISYRKLGESAASKRCPVLLVPPYAVREGPTDDTHIAEATDTRAMERRAHARFHSARLSTVSSFSVAETAGPWFGLRILTDSVQASHPRDDGGYFASRLEGRLGPEIEPSELDGVRFGLDPDQRLALAEGALTGMGLTRDFAEVVLLCGHGSETANNPYGSGLDCGACGGHAGEVNARVAAAVLEDPAVRSGLAERGIHIPESTRFVAGLHVTTTDEIQLYGAERLSAETRARLERWLSEAGEKTRGERLPGLSRGQLAESEAGAEVRRRGKDWSEVRPEWGLARNAAFIAARRSRTRGLDLDGRAFLHDYDLDLDPQRSLLELILTAPLVVAHWINMQYYASTVDNEAFGSGNKLIHNVVGRHGVKQGNRGDLAVGLPIQSVHDGRDFYHEPIRLQAIIEAPPEELDAVLDRHEDVRQLIDNEWICLMSWSREGSTILRRHPGGRWRPV